MLKNGKIIKVALISIIIALIIVTAGCNLVQMNPEADKEQVVAEIGDKQITKQDFNYTLALQKILAKVQGQELPTDEEELEQINFQLLDVIIGDEVLVHLAEQEDISVDEGEVASQVEEMRMMIVDALGSEEEYQSFLEDYDITIEEFDEFLEYFARKNFYVIGLREKISEDVSISDEDVEKYYQDNPRVFDPSTANAKHILVDKEHEELAEEIAQKAQNGEDFDELMEEYGEMEEILEAANLGEFTKAEMVEEFSEAAFALEEGQASDLVETDFGFHIIKLIEKQEEPKEEFEEVQEQLKLVLEQQAEQERFSEYLAEKEEELNIEKYPERL